MALPLQLTDEEKAFGEIVTEFFGFIERMQVAAHKVKAAGGDTQRAFIMQFPESERGAILMQWPMLQMAFGL